VDASFSYALNKVRFDMCFRNDEGRFLLAKKEWSSITYVDLGEHSYFSSHQWARDL